MNRLHKLLYLRAQNDIELHVEALEKRRTRTEIENSGYNLAGFDHFKSEINAELERIEYKDIEDMVHRIELSFDEIVGILDIKFIDGSFFGYVFAPKIYEITDKNSMINFCFRIE